MKNKLFFAGLSISLLVIAGVIYFAYSQKPNSTPEESTASGFKEASHGGQGSIE